MKPSRTPEFSWTKILVVFAIFVTIVAAKTLFAEADSVSASEQVANQNEWPEIALTKIEGDYNEPVHVTHAGDGSGRLFVVERGGTIRIVRNGTLVEKPFLDIRSLVTTKNECGLLSVAFPSNFAQDGYFFVYYNHKVEQIGPTEDECDTVVARFRVTDDPDVADGSSEEQVLVVDQPHDNHNGGQIAFGPDGYLYVGLGDGGSGGDPDNHAQNRQSLLGKLLRLEVSGSGTYAIPPANPFVNQSETLSEIWALGLRNPWRFSFDKHTGQLYIGDVGQGLYEEINVQSQSSVGGENYGWRIMEGQHCYNTDSCEQNGLAQPVWEYGHGVDRSITGGIVYRGDKYVRMLGTYIYGDFNSGRIWGLRSVNGQWQNQELMDTSALISSFGEDEEGNVYMADLNGSVYLISDSVVADYTDFLYLPLVHQTINERTAVGGGDTNSPPTEPTGAPTNGPIAPPETPTTSPSNPNPGTLTWDPRLTERGATLTVAQVAPGTGYWKLVKARWYDVAESEGKHHIFVNTLDENGNRMTGVPILVEWATGAAIVHSEAKPGEDWATNYGMFDVAPSYSARPDDDALADMVGAMGLGSIVQPKYKEHTSYGLTWQWTIGRGSSETPTATPTPVATEAATVNATATQAATATAPATATSNATSVSEATVTQAPPSETPAPAATETSTSVPAATTTATLTPTPTATPSPSPTATPTTSGSHLFSTIEVGECKQDGSGTRFKGYVKLNGQGVTGYGVVWSHERDGRWATNPLYSRDNPLGYYEHTIGPPRGDWYAWVIDTDNKRISEMAAFRIEGGCNVRQVDFVGG